MWNEPWSPSLAALRTPLYSSSNKVLIWGQHSFELIQGTWASIGCGPDLMKSTKPDIWCRTSHHVLLLPQGADERHSRRYIPEGLFRDVFCHLSSEDLWEITKTQANSALLQEKHLPYNLKEASCLPPLLTSMYKGEDNETTNETCSSIAYKYLSIAYKIIVLIILLFFTQIV